MKIISPFKDYYDGFACSMRDDLVFIREQKIFNEKSEGKASSIQYVGFCGNVYPFYEYRGHYHFQRCNAQRVYLHDCPTWRISYLLKNFNESWDRQFSYDGPIWHLKYRYNHENHTYFRQITYNCNLSLLQFMRIKHIHSAYQELAQYLSNMANPEKPLPVLDDKTMRDIKGFDKFSFRKDKKKKD